MRIRPWLQYMTLNFLSILCHNYARMGLLIFSDSIISPGFSLFYIIYFEYHILDIVKIAVLLHILLIGVQKI